MNAVCDQCGLYVVGTHFCQADFYREVPMRGAAQSKKHNWRAADFEELQMIRRYRAFRATWGAAWGPS